MSCFCMLVWPSPCSMPLILQCLIACDLSFTNLSLGRSQWGSRIKRLSGATVLQSPMVCYQHCFEMNSFITCTAQFLYKLVGWCQVRLCANCHVPSAKWGYVPSAKCHASSVKWGYVSSAEWGYVLSAEFGYVPSAEFGHEHSTSPVASPDSTTR